MALADRWADAAAHARTHGASGVHLMEVRRAAILDSRMLGVLDERRELNVGWRGCADDQ